MFNAGKDNPTISALTIKPNKGRMDPLSSIKIEIEFQPMLLGAFKIEFELQVCYNITHYRILQIKFFALMLQ